MAGVASISPSERLSKHEVLAMQRELDSTSAETRLFANAAFTAVALLLVFAAFDDITTDNATTFRVECTFLVGCAGWLLFVAWSLIRAGHSVLGFTSLVALASAIWAQRAIGPSMAPGLRPEHIVITTAYFWFWMLAGAIVWLAWRARKSCDVRFTLVDAVDITTEFAMKALLAVSLGLPLVVLLIRALS
jgi:hypothetical protein